MEQESETRPGAEAENAAPPAEPGYQPRPRWQVWGARLLLAAFLILLIMYYCNIAGSGR